MVDADYVYPDIAWHTNTILGRVRDKFFVRGGS
jgi:hypothetical protein